jgi:hypothetical protein
LVWSLALWLGGFTFYSAAVIPVLHDQLGSPLDTGLVTQRVTDILNALGFATVVLGWLAVAIERRCGRVLRAGSKDSVALLGAFSACLLALLGLHLVMDRRLDSGSLAGFYPLHRAYLWISVLQWLASLGLLACWADVCGRSSRGR